MNLIGIGQEKIKYWYHINIFLYNTMISIAFYTKQTKKPKIYKYNKNTFNFIFGEDSVNCYHNKWFFGLQLK